MVWVHISSASTLPQTSFHSHPTAPSHQVSPALPEPRTGMRYSPCCAYPPCCPTSANCGATILNIPKNPIGGIACVVPFMDLKRVESWVVRRAEGLDWEWPGGRKAVRPVAEERGL